MAVSIVRVLVHPFIREMRLSEPRVVRDSLNETSFFVERIFIRKTHIYR